MVIKGNRQRFTKNGWAGAARSQTVCPTVLDSIFAALPEK
jgi:hypothetical protein